MLISPIRVEGWKLCANAIQFSQVSWKTVQRERPQPTMRTKHGPGGECSPPHQSASGRCRCCGSRIVIISRYPLNRKHLNVLCISRDIYSIFPSPVLLSFPSVRPMFMKNHSHNARTYNEILLSIHCRERDTRFFSFSFFFFTIDLG